MRGAWWHAGAGLLLVATLLLVAGCGSQQSGELYRTREDQFRIENPSRTHAAATGVGCADDERTARRSAERVARYNLRSLTGAADYHVRITRERTWQQDGRTCVEMKAQAYP